MAKIRIERKVKNKKRDWKKRGKGIKNEKGAIIKKREKGGYGKGIVIVRGSKVKQRTKISQCILKRGGIFLLIFKRKITTQQAP